MTRIIVAILFLPAFYACKKSAAPAAGGGNIMTATINDTSQTFNVVALAKNIPSSSGYVLTIACASSNTSSADVMSVSLDGLKPITTGTFTADFSGSSDYLPGMAFQHGNVSAYQEDVSGANPITVTITSISSTNVQGSFKGTLTLVNGNGPFIKKVTNGKFNVDFQ